MRLVSHHQRRRAQAVIVEMMLGIPGRIEAGGFRGDCLLDRVVDDLLRGLVIAALLRQDENAEFHGMHSSTTLRCGRFRPVEARLWP
jgi:hypothetical protein